MKTNQLKIHSQEYMETMARLMSEALESPEGMRALAAAIAVDTGHFATGVVLDQDAEGALGGIGVDGEQVVADHADHLAELTVALDVAVAIGEAAVTRIDE